MSLQPSIIDLTPQQVKRALDANKIILIDVREAHEFADEHIAGALNFPLSCFDPDALPKPDDGRYLVFQCAGGFRSAKALTACHNAGLCIEHHLAGGIGAWKAAGFATVR
jgi:rhodanese-related sulfurtransferase